MILVLGVRTFLRALLGRSTAVTLERRPAADPAELGDQWHGPPSSGRQGLEKVLNDSRKTTRSVCSRGVRFRGLVG